MSEHRSRGHRRSAFAALLGLALISALTGSTYAQLTADDIQALKEQGQREGWTFTVAENGATRYALDDLCGLVRPEGWEKLARWDACQPRGGLPEAFDWRAFGGCTVVKNQASCGSCWAFATVGPLECNIRIRDGIIVDLSEQWLVSCNSDGWDCGGGWFAHDYHQWKTDPCSDTGAVPESAFPYVAWDAPCDCPYPHEYFIEDWAYISGGVDAMKQAILDYGPITVDIYANSALQAYSGGIFNGCADEPINHAVVLVGWDDNQGPGGVWIMRNSWGVTWGEYGGYARIPYGCSNIGQTAAYIVYPGNAPTLNFQYPEGRPELLDPGVETRIPVNVYSQTGTPVPGTGWLHYSRNGGSYYVVAMDIVGENQYEAVLPPADCYDSFRWYVSVQEVDGQRINDPHNAPAYVYSAFVAGEVTTVFEDSFETDLGWTVSGDAADGHWDRGVPIGGGDRGDPPNDYDGSGQCYLTDNVDGHSDVDDGYTLLTSPVLDLSAGDAEIHYALWYTNNTGNNPDDDLFKTWVSNDDGANWTLAETIGPNTSAGWTEHSFMVADLLTPTGQVRVRFEASDLDGGSVVEAGVDDFRVVSLDCQPPNECPEDLNGDGLIDLADLAILLGNYGLPGMGPEDGDLNDDGTIDLADLSQLLGVYGTACP